MDAIRLPATSVKGCFRWWVKREGRVIFEHETPNLIVTVAKTYMADVMRGDKTKLAVMAIGSSATTPLPADTQLGTEVTRLALPAVGTDTATLRNVRTANTVFLRVTFTGLTATIREAGLFGDIASPPGAANAGSLFNHAAVGPIGLIGTDTYSLESQLTFL